MKKENILVTGGFGILGSGLIKLLLKDKTISNIFVIDKSKNKKKIKILNVKNKRVKFIKGNFINYSFLRDLVIKNKINIIFHLGAITQVIDAYKSPLETFRSNISSLFYNWYWFFFRKKKSKN